MAWSGSIARALALLLVFPIACSSSSSAPTPPATGGAGGTSPASARSQIQAATQAYAAQMAVLQAGSSNFTVDLSKSLPPLGASGPESDALLQAVQLQGAWVSAATSLVAAGAGAKSGLAFHVTSSEHTGTVTSRIIGIDDALIIAGIAITAWGAAKGVKKAVEIRTDPAHQKIDQASSGDLKVINQTLGLPATATKAEALKAFDDLGMSTRLTKAKEIEQDLRLAETNNDPDVSSIPAEQIQRSVADSSVECGKTAVKATVSASTFSGQGYAQAAQALGATEKTAAVVDFTISAVSEATDTPLQPLDRLAAYLEATFASKKTTSATVPAVQGSMTPDQATAVLTSTDPKLADYAAAVDAKLHGLLDAIGGLIGAFTSGDGSTVVTVPEQLHQAEVTDPTNVDSLEVRGIGPATVMISAECHVTQTFPVDTSAPDQVDYSVTTNTCVQQGDCATVIQYADPNVTIPAECEKCVNQTCAPFCANCNLACLQGVDACFQKCSDAYDACIALCTCTDPSNCGSACTSPCSSAQTTCDSACESTPDGQAATLIGKCIRTDCASVCPN